jgi:hypothetical protein
MEVAGVPAILAYRGGDKFAGLVPIVDEIPDEVELDPDSLGEVLKRFVFRHISAKMTWLTTSYRHRMLV